MPTSAWSMRRLQAGIPCTVHVALGTDIVHMHPHVSGAALGEASLIDFRRLCSVVADAGARRLAEPRQRRDAAGGARSRRSSVAHNFGHSLDGLVTVNVDKESRYRSTVNVLSRPSSEGLELTGHHEILLPLLHAAVACKLATSASAPRRWNARRHQRGTGYIGLMRTP